METGQSQAIAQCPRPSNDAELKAYVRETFGVLIPDTQICAQHSTPFRAFADAYFARSPVSVWKASRGLGGKTFLLALLTLTEAITLGADVNLLGGSGEQSQRALEHTEKFWQAPNAPRELLKSDPTKRETELTSGNFIRALMASQASVRGPHPQRLRLDEVDEMDVKILDAALGQQQSKAGILSQVVESSTHQNADGTMTECLKRAVEREYPVHEWCYKESLLPHGWLEPSEVERKRSQMTAVSWENEVELQDPSPESRAIVPVKVAQMFDRSLGEFAGEARQYIEIEKPHVSGQYATGGDWAKTRDWTIVVTIRYDVTPAKVIAFERLGREEYPAMIARFEYQCKRFNSVAAHDGTGLGTVVEDILKVPATAVSMVGEARADLLTNYIAAIEQDKIVAPFITWMESEHRLASRADVYQGGSTHHLPDTISAGALAWYAIKHGDWW